jgi:hypothetical protein
MCCATMSVGMWCAVWSTGMVVDDKGEGHAASCRWARSGEGRAPGLDRGTGEVR